MCLISVEDLIAEEDKASMRVFRAGFFPPLVDGAVPVTRIDKTTSDSLPRNLDFYLHGKPYIYAFKGI